MSQPPVPDTELLNFWTLGSSSWKSLYWNLLNWVNGSCACLPTFSVLNRGWWSQEVLGFHLKLLLSFSLVLGDLWMMNAIGCLNWVTWEPVPPMAAIKTGKAQSITYWSEVQVTAWHLGVYRRGQSWASERVICGLCSNSGVQCRKRVVGHPVDVWKVKHWLM